MAKYGLTVRDELAAKIFVAFVSDKDMRQRAYDKAAKELLPEIFTTGDVLKSRSAGRESLAKVAIEYADSFFIETGKSTQ